MDKRITLRSLIVDGLGYCCEWSFWHCYRKNRYTPIIAARLGVSIRACQKHKAAYRRGDLKCECSGSCLLKAIKAVKPTVKEPK